MPFCKLNWLASLWILHLEITWVYGLVLCLALKKTRHSRFCLA